MITELIVPRGFVQGRQRKLSSVVVVYVERCGMMLCHSARNLVIDVWEWMHAVCPS
jgi:hypothetical protein